ncbi:MAG: sensor histidine kinase [Patescibacteria group bacterium]
MQWNENQVISYNHLPLLKHALATPLTSILINAEQALERTKPSEKQFQPLNAIYHQTRHAVSILKMADHTSPSFTKFSLEHLLGDLKMMFPPTTNRQLLVFYQVSHQVLIVGPKTHFLEALICLINNAFESYHQEKNQLVMVSAIKKQLFLEIKIVDAGRGINKSLRSQPRLKSTKENHLGIGLAYVKHILTWYFHAELKIDTRKRLGTTITINLPLN